MADSGEIVNHRFVLGPAAAALCLTLLAPASAKTSSSLAFSAWFPDNWAVTPIIGGLDARDDADDIDVAIRPLVVEGKDEDGAIHAFLDDRLDSFKIDRSESSNVAHGSRVVYGTGVDGSDKLSFVLYVIKSKGNAQVLMLCTGDGPDLSDQSGVFQHTAQSVHPS
jgi:hypothetical protein